MVGDAAGQRQRVVSLLPSATEIVCALGAQDCLVGVSHECDFPEAIQGRPVLTRSRIDPSASSRAIDAAVRAALQEALSLYHVDELALTAAAPDLVITQDLCEVCAVSLDDVRSAVARLVNREQVRILSLKPTRLADVLQDVERIAEALDCAERGARLRSDLEQRLSAVAGRAIVSPQRPRVVSLEWLDPVMVGGTWMPELIALAGGDAAGAEAGRPAPTLSIEQLRALEPEVVLIKPCGFSIQRTLAERASIEGLILAALSPQTRVYVSDGNAYFNRSGPRLVESLEILASCMHPELFPDLVEKHRADVVQLQ